MDTSSTPIYRSKLAGLNCIIQRERKWEWRKKRIPLPKFKRTKIVDKAKIKKLPGKKVSKQEAKNVDRFNKLSLKVQLEKVEVIKKPGLSIKEKRQLQEEIDELLSEEEAEELPKGEKVRIVKKPGVPLREKRKAEPEKGDVPTDKEQESSKVDTGRIVKKPGKSLKEKRTTAPKESELSADDDVDRFNKLSLKVQPEKVEVIKKPGLSIKEKRQLQEEIDELLSEEEAEEPPKGEKVRIVKKPGVPLREKRKAEPEKGDVPTDKEQESSKVDTGRIVKKPGKSLKEKLTTAPKESELSADEESQPPRRNGVVRKPGLSIKEKQRLEKERNGLSDNDHDESDIEIGRTSVKYKKRKSRKERYIDNFISEEEGVIGEMSANQAYEEYDGDNGYEEENYDYQNNQNDTRLPPIDTKHGASPQHSPQSSRKMTVHERLYDPDFRKNRSVSKEPEPIYIREFKSRPPRQLEHVKSKHMDPSYFEPRGEYILETDEEPQQQFRSNPPRNLEHVQSRHLSPEYQKKKQSPDGGSEEKVNAVFVSRPPKKLEHVQSRIKDPKFLQEKPQAEEESYDTEFKARLPKKLEHVQSKIMDPRYLQEKPTPEEERYDNEFKARIPKKMGNVQSRILEPKKQRPISEESETVSLPSFRAKPPKHLEQVGSRILDPAFYEPRPEYIYESEDDNLDHNFKARLPKSLQHVESRALDPKYFKKKTPPMSADDREAMNANHNFKARLPKSLAHVQSRVFDPYYNQGLSPRHSPVIELKQKGQIVVINVKKDAEQRSKSEGYRDKMEVVRGKDGNYYNQWRNDFNAAVKEIRGDKPEDKAVKRNGRHEVLEEEPLPEKKERKPWKPPRKPKLDVVDKQYFDSWVMTPSHMYNDSGDMFYRNRRNVSEMWTSLARSIKKTVVENGDRVQAIERTPFY